MYFIYIIYRIFSEITHIPEKRNCKSPLKRVNASEVPQISSYCSGNYCNVDPMRLLSDWICNTVLMENGVFTFYKVISEPPVPSITLSCTTLSSSISLSLVANMLTVILSVTLLVLSTLQDVRYVSPPLPLPLFASPTI